MKNLISIFISFMFIVLNTAVSVNAEQENADAEWKELYVNFIFVDNNKEERDCIHFYDMALFDIDNDSIPELIMHGYMIDNEGITYNSIIKVYTVENSNVKEIFSYVTDFYNSSISASNNKLYINLILPDIELYEYITFEKIDNDWKMSKITSEDFKPVNKWYGSPITFTGLYDKYSLNNIFSSVLSVKRPNNCFSFDLKYVEEYPQISSPEVYLDSLALEDGSYTHEVILENNIYKKNNKNLLMINGVFFGDCDIIEENGKIFVPLRTIFEKTGKTVDYNASEKTINITGLKNIFNINLNKKICYYNQKDSSSVLEIPMPNDLINVNGSIYISSDILNKDYFQLKTGLIKSLIDKKDFDIVYVENIYQCDIISIEDAIKITAWQENVKHINDLGRYYIFEIDEADNKTMILFNKYTGEIFTERNKYGFSGRWESIDRGNYYDSINTEKLYVKQ